MENAKHRQIYADLLLLLVTLIWGSTFVMVKDAVATYPVFPFLALRFGLAAAALALVGWRRVRTLGWRGVGAGVLIGLFLFAGYAFQTLGLRHTSASKAGFITGLSVVIVPALSTLLLRRRPTRGSLIGVGLATVGLALLTLGADLEIAPGDLLVLGCALSFALHIVAVSVFAPKMDVIALTIVQIATVALASTGLGLAMDHPWPLPAPSTLFAAGFTGILATALAFTAQTAMQRFTTPTHTALIFAAEPVFAALFGVLLAGDVMASRGVAGGILIVCGTVVSELPWSQRTARVVSRFLSPHYVVGPLLLVLGLRDPDSARRGVLWALGIGLPVMTGALLVMYRELRRGRISDWHLSNREERLRLVPISVNLVGALTPLVVLLLFRGPKLLVVASLSAVVLVVANLLITIEWKISQHVSTVAAGTTLLAATCGIGASPALLLIPLVAWARVKVGAHTVMQTIAGGLAGIAVTLAVLSFYGIL